MSDSHGAAPASSDPTLGRKFWNLIGAGYDPKVDTKLHHGAAEKQVQKLSKYIVELSTLTNKDYTLQNPQNPDEKYLAFRITSCIHNLTLANNQLKAHEKKPLDAKRLDDLKTQISTELDDVINDPMQNSKPRNSKGTDTMKTVAETAKNKIATISTADLHVVIGYLQDIAKNGTARAGLEPNEVAADSSEGKKLLTLRNDTEKVIEEICTSEYLQKIEGHERIHELATHAKGAAGKIITRDSAKDGAIVLIDDHDAAKHLIDLRDALNGYLATPDTKVTFETGKLRNRMWRALRGLITAGSLVGGATATELTMDTYGPLQMVGLRDRANFDHLEGKNIAQLVDAKAIVIADRAMNPRIQRKMIEEIDERIAVLEKEYAALGELNSDELQALEKAEKKNLDRASENAAARIQEKIGKINERIRNLTVIKGGHVEGSINASPKVSLAPEYTAQRAGSKVIIETPAGAIDKKTFAIAYQGKGILAHADCKEVSDGKFEFAISAEDANSDLIRIRVSVRDTSSPTGWRDMVTQDLRAR